MKMIDNYIKNRVLTDGDSFWKKKRLFQIYMDLPNFKEAKNILKSIKHLITEKNLSHYKNDLLYKMSSQYYLEAMQL